jgi:hypothetical protein
MSNITKDMTDCVSCQQPLVIEVDDSSDEEDVVMGESSAVSASNLVQKTEPDDVHLNCGCHFHW